MNSYEEFVTSKKTVDAICPRLTKSQEEWLREHWGYFNSKKAELESIVNQEFGKVIREIGLVVSPWFLRSNPDTKGAEVLDYKTKYDSQFKEFRVKITKLKLPNGKIMDDIDVLSSQLGCPHLFLDPICGWGDEVHPKIKKFKEEYSVRYIEEPKNDCEHK